LLSSLFRSFNSPHRQASASIVVISGAKNGK
jgi:hypothetical protein